MRAKVFRWLVVVGAVGLVGCQSHGGGAVPATEEEAPIFNPCSQLSDDVLRKDGLDPASKSTTTDAAEGPTSWRICGWFPQDQSVKVTVYSTSHTVEESRAADKWAGIQDVSVNARPALTYHDKTDTSGDRCYVGFSAQQGMFEVSASWEDSGRKPDLCALAVKYAQGIEPALPK